MALALVFTKPLLMKNSRPLLIEGHISDKE